MNKFIRRLLDTETMKLYLTGSSAKLLSREIATELRGRCITREIFPLSFSEYLEFNKVRSPKHPSSKVKSALTNHLQKYLHQGGFPEIQSIAKEFHRELLQDYVDTVIYRDIAERYEISNLPVLKRFILHCLQNAASSLSINKIYNTFRSMGLSIGKNSLYEYLGYIEDSYCVFSVPAFELSARKSGLKPKKIYPVDPGLTTAYTLKDSMEHAARLETAVFVHLRKQGQPIFYFDMPSGYEVDFLIQKDNGTIELTQACLSIKDPDTKKRELRALEEAMQILQVKQATIVTLDESEEIIVQSGLIRCVPFMIWSSNFSED
ncbi:MAG: ATP-binding protein [Deltaproteobacteria bacterium]|nr:ATP-binding protein [Deltaproteobacteria bacterium]